MGRINSETHHFSNYNYYEWTPKTIFVAPKWLYKYVLLYIKLFLLNNKLIVHTNIEMMIKIKIKFAINEQACWFKNHKSLKIFFFLICYLFRKATPFYNLQCMKRTNFNQNRWWNYNFLILSITNYWIACLMIDKL